MRGMGNRWKQCLRTVLGHLSTAAPAGAVAGTGTGTGRLYEPMSFLRGPPMPNRFMLAPLTNKQSGADGVLSQDEYRWLTKRAEGGFGLVMTCASHVQQVGQGFEGQLGCWSDDHMAGLRRLADGIHAHGR
eukprot:COSAG01_NODE_442_length_17020_cov_26.699622_9_plen_131_part_00